MNTETLETQILSFLQNVREVESRNGAEYVKAKEIEGLFTGSVNFLRSGFPNPTIKRLALVMWDVIAHNVTPLCWGKDVRNLSFVVAGSRTAPQSMILTPTDWHKMVRRDPLTQLGALVFVGSQAIDYVNERFTEDPENVTTRAFAYEAEYINTVKGLSPSWDLTQYHTKLLEDFPEGVATPKASKVLYSAKPLITA